MWVPVEQNCLVESLNATIAERNELKDKLESLKCEFCDGQGEKEKYIEPYGDSPVVCTYCNGTGIDQDQLKKLKFL
jgi:DnaJ-class molecular chaperone